METLPSGARASSRATSPPSAARSRSLPSGSTSPSACWRRSGTGLACRRPEGFSLRASPRTQDSGGTDEGWGPERDRDQRAPCGLGARDGRPPREVGARSARGAGRGRGRLCADELYRAAGATLVPEAGRVLAEADVVVKVQRPAV